MFRVAVPAGVFLAVFALASAWPAATTHDVPVDEPAGTASTISGLGAGVSLQLLQGPTPTSATPVDVWSLSPDELDAFCEEHGGVYMAVSVYNGAFVNVCDVEETYGYTGLWNIINGQWFGAGHQFGQCNVDVQPASCIVDGWYNKIDGYGNVVNGWGNTLIDSDFNEVTGDRNFLTGSGSGYNHVTGDDNVLIDSDFNDVIGDRNFLLDTFLCYVFVDDAHYEHVNCSP